MVNARTSVAAAQINIAANAASAFSNTYLIGGGQAKMPYIKKHVKTSLFTLAPQIHAQNGATPSWNQNNVSFKLGRQGDYLFNQWLRVEVGAVTAGTAVSGNAGLFLRWTHNAGHNIFDRVKLSFSGVPGIDFDELYLDFFSAFAVPAGKRNAYDNMIGNLPELVNPIYDIASGGTQVLPSFVLNVPIPLPYTRDMGVSLPTGALIYNEITLDMDFRNWSDLLVVSNASAAAVAGVAGFSSRAVASTAGATSDIVSAPTFSAELWGHYAVVTSDERKRMGKLTRDLIWENVQQMGNSQIPSGGADVKIDLRYSHAIKSLFFALRNKTVASDMSNYTSREPLCHGVVQGAFTLSTVEFPAPNAFDPIQDVTLSYENSDIFTNVPIDYFSLLQPFMFARVVPTITGYHVYSYSLDLVDTNHLGSVDFAKLTNVSMRLTLSTDAKAAMAGAYTTLPFIDEQGVASALPPGYRAAGLLARAGEAVVTEFASVVQSFETIELGLAHTVLRVTHGSAGWPLY